MILVLALAASLADPRIRPASLADPRIRSIRYDPARVVAVEGHVAIQSTIAFAPDERIENVAIGDSSAWQVTPNRRADLLFLKPMGPRARTNMTVVTDRRRYLFDLRSGAQAVYALSFTYPAAPVVAAPPLPPPAIDAAPKPMLVAATISEPKPTDLDFAWDIRGSHRLAPARAFSDGRSLYLAWPKDAALPAMFTTQADGSEGPVNYTTRGDYVIVEGVPRTLVLRSGKESATVTALRVPVLPTRTAER